MAQRWAAAGCVEAEKHYRRIMGCRQLWMLKAVLDGPIVEENTDKKVANRRKAG